MPPTARPVVRRRRFGLRRLPPLLPRLPRLRICWTLTSPLLRPLLLRSARLRSLICWEAMMCRLRLLIRLRPQLHQLLLGEICLVV